MLRRLKMKQIKLNTNVKYKRIKDIKLCDTNGQRPTNNY